MQTLVNVLVVLDTLIIGFGVYMVVTAKTVGESRAKKNAVKSKDPVKAAFEFEATPIPKKRGRPVGSKNKKANSSKAKKVSG